MGEGANPPALGFRVVVVRPKVFPIRRNLAGLPHCPEGGLLPGF